MICISLEGVAIRAAMIFQFSTNPGRDQMRIRKGQRPCQSPRLLTSNSCVKNAAMSSLILVLTVACACQIGRAAGAATDQHFAQSIRNGDHAAVAADLAVGADANAR